MLYYILFVNYKSYPVGEVIKFQDPPDPRLPFLLCEGQALFKSKYPSLYEVIGDSYSIERKYYSLKAIRKLLGLQYYEEHRNCADTQFRIPNLKPEIVK